VVRDLTADLAERYGYEEQTGVIVTRVAPGSEAAEKGLRAGYMILQVNRQPVSNVEQYSKLVSEAIRQKRRVLLLVSNGQVSQYVTLSPSQE
jgi:serine protease Do